MKILRMTNQDERFYPTMGPYLSRREIVKELGYPVWDESGKKWFVATVRGKTEQSVPLLRSLRFAETRKHGRYTYMRRNI